jgi:hypothetical protein
MWEILVEAQTWLVPGLAVLSVDWHMLAFAGPQWNERIKNIPVWKRLVDFLF